MKTRCMIYRGVASVGSEIKAKRICFVSAFSPEQALTRMCEGVSLVYGVTPFEVGCAQVQSEDDLKAKGLSYHPEWRLFEGAWSNGRCEEWIQAPLFLTPDSRIQHVWASLPLAGSREVFADSLAHPAERALKQVMMNKVDAYTLARENDEAGNEQRLTHELNGLMELTQHPVFSCSADIKEFTEQVHALLDHQ